MTHLLKKANKVILCDRIISIARNIPLWYSIMQKFDNSIVKHPPLIRSYAETECLES